MDKSIIETVFTFDEKLKKTTKGDWLSINEIYCEKSAGSGVITSQSGNLYYRKI